MTKRSSFILGLILTLFVCLGIFFHYGEKKEIGFCDEVYTHTMANVHSVQIAVRDNKWYQAWEMDKRLCSKEGYNFKGVMEGAAIDISPPLYYLAFKAVAATFPDSASKWLGFGTNLFFFVPFLVLLYVGIWKITKKPWLALSFTVLLGVNSGMQGVALLIRMYMMMILCMQIFFMLTEKLYSESVKTGIYLGLGTVTFVGFMTHYYFAIYVALFSAFFMLYKMLQKNWKQAFAYLGSMMAAVAAATAFFPAWISQIFASSKGSSSIDAMSSWSGFGEEVLDAMEDVGEYIFPDKAWLYWMILIIICVLFFTLKDSVLTDIKKNFGFHLAVQMIYYCVVAHVMPSPEPRYYWAVVVVQCIMALYMLAYILKHYGLLEKKAVIALVLGIAVIYTAFFHDRMKEVPYHDARLREGRLVMEQYDKIPWIIFGERDWVLHCTVFDFLIPEQLMFITDELGVGYDDVIKNTDEIVLYVRNEEDLEATVERLIQVSGRRYTYELLAERSYNDAYLITRE